MPAVMKNIRRTIARRIPMSKTRAKYFSLTLKKEKMRIKTKILSTLRLHSIRYALKYSKAGLCPFSYHKNAKKANARQTQNIVWYNAFLIVKIAPFLLKSPKSKITAIISIPAKVKYASCEGLNEFFFRIQNRMLMLYASRSMCMP